MKISKKLVFSFVIFAVALSGLSVLRASAQDESLTSQQIDIIRSNCLSVKNTLNQLHASDALLRVNRGQLYESIQTKLMDGFNGRVANNHYDNTGFVSVTNSYESALDTFRSDYKTYEEQLALAIGIDCSKQPVAFYDAVASARTKRDRVHADVLKLNQYLDQYQTSVNQFEKDYQTLTNSGVKQ